MKAEKISIENINDDDIKFINSGLRIFHEVYQSVFKSEIISLTPIHIDELRDTLKIGTRFFRNRRERSVWTLGAVLGQYFVDNYGCKWVNCKGNSIEQIGVYHKKSDWVFFPFNNIRERLRSKNSNEISDLVISIVKEIEN